MFERITPEEAGISSDHVAQFIAKLERRGTATHSVLMMKGDKIFAEYYWAPFHKDFNHRMYSQTKSYVSIAIGLLEEEGKLTLDDKLVDWFPDKIDGREQPEFINDITIREMLTMSTAGNPPFWFFHEDSDRAHLYFAKRRHYHPSATIWEYDSPGSQMLGEIVERASGMSLFDYLKAKVFDHLGTFKTAQILKVPGGASWGDSALLCTSRDMASFARFVMNYGMWNGKRLMNEEYLRVATSAVVDNRENSYCCSTSHGYGYQIWRTEKGFMFNGMGGQYTMCFPDKDLIFVITADNQGFDQSKVTVIDGFIDTIYENMQNAPLKPSKAAEKRLSKATKDLKLRAVYGLDDSPVRERINGKTFICDENPMGIKKFKLTFFKNGTGNFEYVNAQGKKKIKFGINKNVFGKFPQLGYSNEVGGVITTDGFMYDDAVSGCWTVDGKFILKVQIIDKYFGNMSAVFGFKGKYAAAHFTKCAEAFLDEYQGRFNAILKD